jgi:uncharacterized protein YprB with RNaseH-like and TPR domain
MSNSLKKSLDLIKARAKARALKLPSREEAPELIEDLVRSGSVSKGPPPQGSESGRRAGAAAEDTGRPAPSETGSEMLTPLPMDDVVEVDAPLEGAPDVDAFLARYKLGDAGPIEAIEHGEARSVGGESVYIVRPSGPAVDPTAPHEAEAFGRLCAWPAPVSPEVYGTRRSFWHRHKVPSFDRDAVCFLDIETTGLSPSTFLFLCGLLYWEKGTFVAEQVFARHYAEEPALLRYVRDFLGRFETVVTYNGLRFDLPFIETRLAANRIPPLRPFASVDLLYTARRLFREMLPNCRLATVERHVRGIRRTGDIPGRLIPEAYHDYVRTGDARVMKHVLYHNRMDLFTLVVLLNRLAAEELG